MKRYLSLVISFSLLSAPLLSMDEVQLSPREMRDAREEVMMDFQAPPHLKGIKKFVAKYPLLSAQMAFYVSGAAVGGVIGWRCVTNSADAVKNILLFAFFGGSVTSFVTFSQGATHDLAATLLELIVPEEFEKALNDHVSSLMNKKIEN